MLKYLCRHRNGPPGKPRAHPKGLDQRRSDPPMIRNQDTAPAPPSAPECFACYEGVVFIGHLVEDEDGDTAEVFEPVPCRRCSEKRGM